MSSRHGTIQEVTKISLFFTQTTTDFSRLPSHSPFAGSTHPKLLWLILTSSHCIFIKKMTLQRTIYNQSPGAIQICHNRSFPAQVPVCSMNGVVFGEGQQLTILSSRYRIHKQNPHPYVNSGLQCKHQFLGMLIVLSHT